MDKKRVTMRDIASECGVSPATVSNALNYSAKERIGDDLRLKIIRTATRMNYRPAPRRESAPWAAVILCLNEQNAPGKMLHYGDLAAELAGALQARGIRTELRTCRSISEIYSDAGLKALDAWLVVDLDDAGFSERLEGFYGPMLLLESEVDEPLYCKVQPDYAAVFEKAARMLGSSLDFIVMEEVKSRGLLNKMTVPFAAQNVFINRRGASLADFLQRHKGKKGIVFGDVLGLEATLHFPVRDLVVVSRTGKLCPAGEDAHCIYVENSRLAVAAAEALSAMLAFDYEGDEGNHITIAPEA